MIFSLKDRILQADLLISKVSLMNLQKDIRHWGTSANFEIVTSRQKVRQKKRTNKIIVKKENENKVE